jgi:hypothetical protein
MHHNAPDEEAEAPLDLRQLRERASYGARALRRNPGTVALVMAATLFAAVLLAWALPDRYRVEARLLAQRDDVIATLSNPGRPVLPGESNPGSSTVSDMVLRRDNLLSVIRQADLLQHWRNDRPPLLRAKDWVVFRRQLDDEELTEVLVGTLEKQIVVTAQEGGVITVAVVWDDPVIATKIAQTALDKFIESRNVNDLAVVGESITLLEQRVAEAQKGMEEALSGAKSLPRAPSRVTVPGESAPAARIVETVELARLHGEITAKRRAMDELVTFRDRKIAEMQAELAQQRAVYSDNHPVVANLRRSIEAMSTDSPQLIQERHEVAELEARYVQRGGLAATLEGIPIARVGSGSSSASLLAAALGGSSRDPGEEYARSRLAASIVRYYGLADRLEAARIERDAARAGIKFRYVMVKPPLPPQRSQTGPYKGLLVLAGVLAAPLLAGAAALGLELRRGRIVQQWQVERMLGLPVLAVLPAANRSR